RSAKSSWRRWAGSTGGTRPGSTRRSTTALQRQSKRPTLTPRRPRPRPSNHGTKPKALHYDVAARAEAIRAGVRGSRPLDDVARDLGFDPAELRSEATAEQRD